MYFMYSCSLSESVSSVSKRRRLKLWGFGSQGIQALEDCDSYSCWCCALSVSVRLSVCVPGYHLNRCKTVKLPLPQGGTPVSIACCPTKRAMRLCHGWCGIWSIPRICKTFRFHSVWQGAKPTTAKLDFHVLHACYILLRLGTSFRRHLIFIYITGSGNCYEWTDVPVGCRYFTFGDLPRLGFMVCLRVMGFRSQRITPVVFAGLLCAPSSVHM